MARGFVVKIKKYRNTCKSYLCCFTTLARWLVPFNTSVSVQSRGQTPYCLYNYYLSYQTFSHSYYYFIRNINLASPDGITEILRLEFHTEPTKPAFCPVRVININEGLIDKQCIKCKFHWEQWCTKYK